MCNVLIFGTDQNDMSPPRARDRFQSFDQKEITFFKLASTKPWHPSLMTSKIV